MSLNGQSHAYQFDSIKTIKSSTLVNVFELILRKRVDRIVKTELCYGRLFCGISGLKTDQKTINKRLTIDTRCLFQINRAIYNRSQLKLAKSHAFVNAQFKRISYIIQKILNCKYKILCMNVNKSVMEFRKAPTPKLNSYSQKGWFFFH